MTIEELFGTLQQSVVATWRKHLKTKKYSSHMALDDYYKNAPELIDTLIENWQGAHEKVEDYVNVLDGKEYDTAVDYLTDLRKVCKDGAELLDSSELKSDLDAILSLIDSTIYKLRELKESRGLVAFIHNSLVNESKTSLANIADYTESWTRQCWDDKELSALLVAMTNGVYRELAERQVLSSTTDKEKAVADKWLDIIEKIYTLIK